MQRDRQPVVTDPMWKASFIFTTRVSVGKGPLVRAVFEMATRGVGQGCELPATGRAWCTEGEASGGIGWTVVDVLQVHSSSSSQRGRDAP